MKKIIQNYSPPLSIKYLFDVVKLICELKLKMLIIFCDFIDSLYSTETTPKKKVEDLIHLAELCIDLLQQNEEHHSEVSRYSLFFSFHSTFFFRLLPILSIFSYHFISFI